MRTFLILLKKELRELITWQLILPLLITAGMFFAIGGIVSSEQDRAKESQAVVLVDRDQSAASAVLQDTLTQANFKVESTENAEASELVKVAREKNAQVILIVPEGFGTRLAGGEQQSLETISLIRNFSFVGNQSGMLVQAVVDALNQYFRRQLITETTQIDPEVIERPITTSERVAVNERIAEGKAVDVLGFVSAQTTFIPIIFFFVIIFAAQMVATAVASEKENKTIETLLSMPVSRRQVVAAKLVAAGLIALIASGAYLAGFRAYIDGLSGGALNTIGDNAQSTIDQLGLVFHPWSYALLAVSLFMGILVSLAMAMILGAFAEDIKAVQSLITPLMVLAVIPYILTLFLDVNSLTPALRYAVYAIPFTHAFQAAPNLFLQQYSTVILGTIYQLFIFIVFVYLAGLIFTTDRIVTMNLNWGKRKRPTV